MKKGGKGIKGHKHLVNRQEARVGGGATGVPPKGMDIGWSQGRRMA